MIDNIQFIDLHAQQSRISDRINSAINTVLRHGKYIMGPEVAELENKLAAYCGVKHAISCSNGTDALLMVLMALNVSQGDVVFLPAFTFTATPEVVALLGAELVFVDVQNETFNICPESLEKAILSARKAGLNPKAIMAVDLFGQMADYPKIQKIADEYQLQIIADAAQSFGASLHGKMSGDYGIATTFSFFPAKPLGCYGDGGCIVTNDDQFAEILRSIRVHGKGAHKYDNVRIGLNARLDTIQAAILLEKLRIFPDEVRARQELADFYSANIGSVAQTPGVIEGGQSVWAQYTLALPDTVNRQIFSQNLKEAGVPTAIYYDRPLHHQTAYSRYHLSQDISLEISEKLSKTVISLPMSAYVTEKQRDYVVEMVQKSI